MKTEALDYKALAAAALSGWAIRSGLKQSVPIAMIGAVASYVVAKQILIEQRDKASLEDHHIGLTHPIKQAKHLAF